MLERNSLPIHPTKRHPHTGAPLRAIFVRRDGRVFWPILGASPDDPADAAAAAAAAATAAAEKAATEKAAADAAAAKGGGDDADKDRGFPKDTPVAQMKPEEQAAYHLFHSRKHEGRSKEWSDAFPGKSATEIKAIVDEAEKNRRNTLTLDQKTIEDAQAEARKSALAEIGPKAVRSAFDLLLSDMPDTDKAEVLDTLDLSKFLTSDNEVDTAKVKSAVARLNPAGKAPHSQRVRDFGAGDRRTDKSNGVKAGRDLFSERRKTTTSTTDS